MQHRTTRAEAVLPQRRIDLDSILHSCKNRKVGQSRGIAMLKMTNLRGILAACCLVLVAATGVRAEPLKIRLGYGVAAEEQLAAHRQADDRQPLRQGLHHRRYTLLWLR